MELQSSLSATPTISATFIQTLTSLLIPIITVGLGYVVWRLQAARSDKIAAQREAYQKFYLRFISLMYQFQLFESGFSRMEPKLREEFFLFIMGNIQYMEEDEIDYIDVLCSHYLCIKRADETGTAPGFISHDRLDEIFDAFTKSVLQRAEKLAHNLHQPEIGRFVLSVYLDTQEERKKRIKAVAQVQAQMR